MENINRLITYLIAIANYAKDIHYNVAYAEHLLADKVQENLTSFIDELKESVLLANDVAVLRSTEYLKEAIAFVPNEISFNNLKALITDTLKLIESIEDTKGTNKLLDDIAADLQQSLALINLQVKNNV